MRKKIYATLSFIHFILLLGIIGGVEMGEPLTNVLYFIPCLMFFGIWTVLATTED